MDMQFFRISLGLRITVMVVALSDGALGSDRCFPLCQSHSFVLYVCNNSPHISSGMSSPFMAVCTGAP